MTALGEAPLLPLAAASVALPKPLGRALAVELRLSDRVADTEGEGEGEKVELPLRVKVLEELMDGVMLPLTDVKMEGLETKVDVAAAEGEELSSGERDTEGEGEAERLPPPPPPPLPALRDGEALPLALREATEAVGEALPFGLREGDAEPSAEALRPPLALLLGAEEAEPLASASLLRAAVGVAPPTQLREGNGVAELDGLPPPPPPLPVALALAHPVALCAPLTAPVRDGEPEGEGDRLLEAEGDALRVRPWLSLCASEAEARGDAVAGREAVLSAETRGEPVAAREALLEEDGEPLTEALPVCERERGGVAEPQGEEVPEVEGLTLRDPLPLPVPVGCAAVAVARAVAEEAPVGCAVADCGGVTEGVGVGVAENDAVCVVVGVELPLLVVVGVALQLSVDEGETLGVGVTLLVALDVAEADGEGEAVALAVSVEVGVPVADGVVEAVALAVGVAVALGVGVPLPVPLGLCEGLCGKVPVPEGEAPRDSAAVGEAEATEVPL